MKIKTIIYTALITLLLYSIFAGFFQYFHHFKPNNGKVIEVSTPNSEQTTNDVNLSNLNTDVPQSPVTNEDTNISVPVLMYHYIRNFNDSNDKIGTNLSVSPTNFDSQLKWLKDNSYKTVDFDYLLNKSFDYAQDQNYKYVILTFDDGYSDAYINAFPILKKYDFTATFYIITNSVGKDQYISWDQIIEMKTSGMNIGSHTLSHPDLSKTTTVKSENEIFQSKNIIEEKIGDTIDDFCYPSGKYIEDNINILKKYNYKTATTTKSGIYDSSKNSFFEIPRLRITNDTNFSKILP